MKTTQRFALQQRVSRLYRPALLSALSVVSLCMLGRHVFAEGLDEGQAEHGNGHGMRHESDDHEPRSLEIGEALIQEFQLELSEAGPGQIIDYVYTPGAVEVNQEALSHISARFPGIVREVRKKVGDAVKKDDVLAVVESNESLTVYPLKSLIDGVVIDKHAALGELLREEDKAFTVADLNTVWVHLSIYQADIPKVRVGQEVVISQGHDTLGVTSHIQYVSPVIDPITRTATARAVLSNTSGTWMPGLFITGKIKVRESSEQIVIPRTAVFVLEGRTHVFVQTAEGFKSQEITIGQGNETHVPVMHGLSLGQRYVSNNGFTLKAELSKSSFDDGHHH